MTSRNGSETQRLSFAVVALALVITACSRATASPGATSSAASAASSDSLTSTPTAASASASRAAAWSYEGQTGPAHWAELDPAYHACADGKTQSPIDIFSPDERNTLPPVFDYHAGDAKIVNDGHTVLAIPTGRNTIEIDHNTFVNPDSPAPSLVVERQISPLVQLRFHAPSEHILAHAPPAAAEVQFVHQDPSGVVTIVGAMVVAGQQDNVAWAPYVDAMTTQEGTDSSAMIDWPNLLPREVTAWNYDGSLTTPPCTEGVHWIFLTKPISLSAAQIGKLRAAYDGNARPTWPLGPYRDITINLGTD